MEFINLFFKKKNKYPFPIKANLSIVYEAPRYFNNWLDIERHFCGWSYLLVGLSILNDI